MPLSGIYVKILNYSPDTGKMVMVIDNNKYEFRGVSPYIKDQLLQYAKYDNKKAFFKEIKKLDYTNLTKQKKEKGEDNQLSLFENLKKIIQQEISNILQEAKVLPHFDKRVKDRLKGNKTTPSFPYDKVKDDIGFLKKIQFPGQYNIGVRIFSSKQPYHYKNVADGKEEESYGRHLWIVVRANEMETLFFMRDGETPRNTQFQVSIDFLRNVISQKNDYSLKVDDLKGKPKKKRKRGIDFDLPSVDLMGKEWYIDVENDQIIYSKNIKKKISIDQALEDLPEEEAEKIMAYV